MPLCTLHGPCHFLPLVRCRVTSPTLPPSLRVSRVPCDKDGLCSSPSTPTTLTTGPPTKLLRTFNYSATSHLTSHKSLNIALCNSATLPDPHALTSVIYIKSFNECVSLRLFDSTSSVQPRHLRPGTVLRNSPLSADRAQGLIHRPWHPECGCRASFSWDTISPKAASAPVSIYFSV